MDGNRLPRLARWGILTGLATLTLGVGLGNSARLSYHEAIVAQTAREMLDRGELIVPTLGGIPWLEKPPLVTWLVAGLGWAFGGIDETCARLPSALAAFALAIGVSGFAGKYYGRTIALLAGLVQLTTVWTVSRGRLADPDMILAALVAWTFLAFDRLRSPDEGGLDSRRKFWRWMFFGLLGMLSLVKGIGFGAVLVGASLAAVLIWERDLATLRRLIFPPGWLLAASLTLAWPFAVLWREPEAWRLWLLHVTDRLAAQPQHFASEPIWQYALAPIVLTLPWSLFALGGAWRSWHRMRDGEGTPADRLLAAWAFVPAVLVSLASVRNAHYLIHALPPWSVWAALALNRLGERLLARGWSPGLLRRRSAILFTLLGLGIAAGYTLLGPRLDHRGLEWSWYSRAARHLAPSETLTLLYDDWDRDPYPTPHGPVPHDLAVRLFYLDHPSSLCLSPSDLLAQPPSHQSFSVIARERDLPTLLRLGPVTMLSHGPSIRWDRTYALYRVQPSPATRFPFEPDPPTLARRPGRSNY